MKSGVDEVFNKELHVWQIRFLKTFAYRKWFSKSFKL